MSKIEWTDQTWNPTVGCSRVSSGCENCYAERVAHRGMSESHRGLTVMGKRGPRWTGEVRLLPERLAEPLRWRKPRRVFVDSMSDLFHEAVPDDFIDAVFGIMWACRFLGRRDPVPGHTFQLLTKRPERMRRYLDGAELPERWAREAVRYGGGGDPDGLHDSVLFAARARGLLAHPRIWLGVSVEDQPTAVARVTELLECRASLRWVSYEPALGGVDFSPWLGYEASWKRAIGPCGCAAQRDPWDRCDACEERGWEPPAVAGIGWVVVGGESGPGARPFDITWARSLIAQSAVAGIPVFVKQLGANPVKTVRRGLPPRPLVELRGRKGDKHGDPTNWPEDLRVRQYPEAA